MESVIFDSYHILTNQIAAELSTENIKTIKFLIRECGKGVLERVVTGTDLIQLLEEKAWLSAENVEKLSKLLQLARRNDLDTKVQQYVESAITRNLSNHDYYGILGMQINAHYIETAEYKTLCSHMDISNLGILKGPPGTWKSLHAFTYAYKLSSQRNGRHDSLIWRIDCNTDLNIYNSLSHLMNYLKLQCVYSENQMEMSIKMMLSHAVIALGKGRYKTGTHLFILLGFISPNVHLMDIIIKNLNQSENIQVIATTSKSLSNEFNNDVINVKGMTEKEAITFLKCDDSSLDQAKLLAKKLSYLPDGLVFARTYINGARISIAKYLVMLETVTADAVVCKACKMLIKQAENNMSIHEKKLLRLLPYMNTYNIPVFILKALLPHSISQVESSVIVDNFLQTLSDHSLISIKGVDDDRVISAHSFTLMTMKASKPKEERMNDLHILLNFFVSYLDLDARLLEVIHRNVLLLDHAEAFLSTFEEDFKSESIDVIAMQCYLLCAIGITFRLYGNTELTADNYLMRAKHILYKKVLCCNPVIAIENDLPWKTLQDILNGNETVRSHAEKIFTGLLAKGRQLSQNCIETFTESKIRTSRNIGLLCQFGDIDVEYIVNNQLSGDIIHRLRQRNLIMKSEHISETFFVELLIRILYNNSKNKWLMELSKDEFSSPEKGKLRRHLSSTYLPVTPESLSEHQIAHRLTQLLQAHMSHIQIGSHTDSSHTEEQKNNRIASFCPVFSPVTQRSGVLYMLRSVVDQEKMSYLLKEAIEVLEGIDSGISGTGFTEFGVVKRIGDSSLFHSVMIDRIKMECWGKLSKIDETNRMENLEKALEIANRVEKRIDEMTPWKALSGVHLKIAKVFKLSETEENIQKAKIHYKRAYDREYESNNIRFTRFHLKAVIHYAECCLQYPREEDLIMAKKLSIDMQNRFQQLEEIRSMFDEVIGEIEKKREDLEVKKTTWNEKQVHELKTKYVQTFNGRSEYNAGRLFELQKRRQKLHIELETIEKEIKKIQDEQQENAES